MELRPEGREASLGRGYSECKGPEARVSRDRRRLVCGSGMQWVRREWRQMRVEADEGRGVGRGQTTQHLGVVGRDWDFIPGAVGALGRTQQGRDII